ncbi:hypothetical protein [Seonamhaeicola sp. ML3]|uniref:hypothetical protein n=1 Tax=Seonamhaeicola sp. ML3 TaxID=2937786 RepID=UPI00200DDAFE|nr:hypothetical protein [Seonamhaeicola sp. ML3]
MQLYRSRGFGDFFQDTFAFLKQNGKHFFKHYFIINGIFLLLLLAMGYFFTKFYTDFIFGSALRNQDMSAIDNFMNDNFGLFIVLLFFFVIVALIAGTVSYAYMPIYLKLYNENSGKGFDTKDIISTYKNNLGKIGVFVICSILLFIPLIIVLGICSFILMITIIGILAIPLLFGGFMLFYTMTLMEYLNDEKGIWECFGYSWSLITSKFWAAIGSVGIFYLMSYIAQNVVGLIPYFFGMASLFSSTYDGDQPSNDEIGLTFTIIMMSVFFISFILGAILGNIVQLNQGIVYYGLKEGKENINTKDDIDLIGSGE